MVLCDLDIINPYFRMADAAEALSGAGVQVITSRLTNTNVDAPALPAEARAIFDDRDITGVIDLGGDDRGALALGRYASLLRNGGGYEMLLVINQYRPLTRSLDDLREMKNEVETASKVSFTGMVNNSNLAAETTLDDVIATADFATGVAAELALPLKMTALDRRLVQNETAARKASEVFGEVFPFDLYQKQNWKPQTNGKGEMCRK